MILALTQIPNHNLFPFFFHLVYNNLNVPVLTGQASVWFADSKFHALQSWCLSSCMQSQISQPQKYTSVCLPPVTVLLLLSLLPVPIAINKTLKKGLKNKPMNQLHSRWHNGTIKFLLQHLICSKTCSFKFDFYTQFLSIVPPICFFSLVAHGPYVQTNIFNP